VPAQPLPTLEHPTFIRIVRKDDRPLGLRRKVRTSFALESDAPDGYLAVHELARLVAVDPTLQSFEFVRASDFRGGRARISVRTALPAESVGTLVVRLSDAEGIVHSDEAPFLVADPPPPDPATADDGRARLRVPEIYEVYSPEWPRLGFNEASVATASESTDDYSILVNMDNRHLRRLLTNTAYQEHGIARMKSSFLVQVAFYAFLLHEARGSTENLDDTALESYQQRELDRVAQTVVTAIASVERIDSAALFDTEQITLRT
jgi:hypothetical protein